MWFSLFLFNCANFYNSSFNNTRITANAINTSCEDIVNIIDSSGQIQKLEVYGASADGLDIDFSDVSIDYLKINGAGNDCADFSKGNYVLGSVTLSNCGDKGISIGEQSTLSIKDLNVNHANIGIASKDSSITSIHKSHIINVDLCLDVFQKKQEFFSSTLFLDDYTCNSNKIFLDDNSNIFYNEL